MEGLRVLVTLKPQELVDMLKKNKKLLIIDVRDRDYGEEGIIKGSINIQSMFFNAAVVDDVIKQAIEMDAVYIITYCSLGQQRSVKVAKTFINVISQMENPPLIQIAYLEGGFRNFLKSFKNSEFWESV